MARKTYTREFKIQALGMMADQGLSVAEVARRLGVGENCLRNWRAAAAEKAELTFRFIADQRGDCPVAWACSALDVSGSGYHAWAARPASRTELRRGELLAAIEEVHAEVKGRYGSPRMTAELNDRGFPCAENTVAKLMKEHGIRAKTARRFVRTTDSRHGLPVADNLLDRDFNPSGPNQTWCA